MIRIALLALLLSAIPARAQAQSVFVHQGALHDGRFEVGALGGAMVSIARWEGAGRPIVRYEDDVIEIEAAVELDAAQVAIGVGEETIVHGVGGFDVRMQPGTWAPLAGRASDGDLRIHVPRGLPVRRATIDPHSTPASRPDATAFSHGGIPWRDFSIACASFRMRATRTPDARSIRVARGTLMRTEGERAPFAMTLWIEGFVVRGFVDAHPATCSGGRSVARSARVCFRFPREDTRVVRAGSELMADTPFARLRVDRAASPSGTRWAIARSIDHGASWAVIGIVSGVVDVPAPLPDDTQACSQSALGWPRQ
jgi:hypothetical protein